VHAAEDWRTTRSERDFVCAGELGELTACGMNDEWDAIYLLGRGETIYKGAAAQRHTPLVGLGVAHSHYTPPGSAAASHAAALIVSVVNKMRVSLNGWTLLPAQQ
jgi:hypothetical protein